MSTLERLEPERLFPALLDWLEAPFAPRPGLTQSIRVEDYTEDGAYVVHAELPGVDPDKDVEITVSGGVLTIRGERREEKKEARRSEFRYGSFSRSLVLPADVDVDDITASYDKGVLTVKVPLPATDKPKTKRIAVKK